MPAPVQGSTEITERLRKLLINELEHGWSRSRVASEMQALGFPGWNEHIVNSFASGKRQFISLDEGLGLIAVFGARTLKIGTEIENLTKRAMVATEKRGSPKREGF
jgi:hypothetical protein